MIHDEKTAEIEIPQTNVVHFPVAARRRSPQPARTQTKPAEVMPLSAILESRKENRQWMWRVGAVLLILALSFLIF